MKTVESGERATQKEFKKIKTKRSINLLKCLNRIRFKKNAGKCQ